MKANFNCIFLLGFLFAFTSGCSTKKAIVKMERDTENVKFFRTDNLGHVLDYAAKEGKQVYVDIYTDWCLPCKMMTESVYTDKQLADYLNENFVCYKVHGEKVNGPDLVALFNIANYPGILFLDDKGYVLEKNLGGLNKAELTEMGNRVLQRY